MNNKTILHLYERLESLVAKLPSALQRPILQEMTPVKNLFLRARSPRIVIAGEGGAGKAHVLNALFNAEILNANEAVEVISGWHEYRSGRGAIRVLDVRLPAGEAAARSALADEPPDIFLFLRSTPGVDESLAAQITNFNALLDFQNARDSQRGAVIGVLIRNEAAADVEEARAQLHACLHTKPAVSERLAATVALTAMRFRLDGSLDMTSVERASAGHLAQLIAEELPEEARLEMARLCGVREVQLKIAQTLIKAVTAICTTIGVQPIPFADYPILTALQVMMISGIMHISGREMSVKLAGEFVTALGANAGAGLVLREGARALSKLALGWGNLLSGAIAGAGTYALGRAASAYFIEGLNIKDARKLFRRKAKREAIGH
jgi:uncharacterized protein (DUF697 family)